MMTKQKRKGLTDMHTDLVSENSKMKIVWVISIDPEDKDEIEI